MDPFKTLESLINAPEGLIAERRPEGLGRAGMLGYFSGTLGLFVFMRIFSALPPGVTSFVTVLSLVLASNFIFAALVHLFLDLTGAEGRASRLFLAFGCSDFLLTALVPMAFFSKLGYINAFIAMTLCLLLPVYARVKIVRRLYPVSLNKAVLAVWLPYAGFSAAFFTGFLYFVVWMVWLIV